ncbi:DNA polymerase IV [Mycoplasmatota bacterium]|nr:DNA polymerase IV [Mycoplasmatota bacterium]
MKSNVKIIFHIDMNAFFISCELINHPELKNKPLAIAGKAAIYNKGVVVTASYEARKYGVKAAMPVFEARRLCPHILCIPSNMALYRENSRKFICFLQRYSKYIEVASIDEAYLDVTERCQNIHPITLAKEIQQKLVDEYQLPTSIGIATNKFLAKMASDMKKPMGITVLRNKEIKEKLWPLPIGDMYGIGKKTAPKLISKGIKTIGELVKEENKDTVKEILGNQYTHFYQNALGYGNNVVDPERYADNKSIGNSSTYRENIVHERIAYKHLRELTESVVKRLNKHRYLTKTITVQIKYVDFKSYTKSKTISNYTDEFHVIYNIIIDLFDVLWNKSPIRLLGVSTSHLIEKKVMNKQLSLFNYEHFAEDEQIVKLMNKINRKYGDNTIKKGNKLKK